MLKIRGAIDMKRVIIGGLLIIGLLGCSSTSGQSLDKSVLQRFCNLYMGMSRVEVREKMGEPNTTTSDTDAWFFKKDFQQLEGIVDVSGIGEADWSASVSYTGNLAEAMWVNQFANQKYFDLPCPQMRD
jgi:outer membrane protein assembly factor BamE (lipoprotein component of BamABCDE complex)